jgi:hypothetical protein
LNYEGTKKYTWKTGALNFAMQHASIMAGDLKSKIEIENYGVAGWSTKF